MTDALIFSAVPKPDSGTSPGLFFGLAILVVVGTVGLIVLWQRLHPEDPVSKRRHLKEGSEEAIEYWDQVQQDRAAGRWWKG